MCESLMAKNNFKIAGEKAEVGPKHHPSVLDTASATAQHSATPKRIHEDPWTFQHSPLTFTPNPFLESQASQDRGPKLKHREI